MLAAGSVTLACGQGAHLVNTAGVSPATPALAVKSIPEPAISAPASRGPVRAGQDNAATMVVWAVAVSIGCPSMALPAAAGWKPTNPSTAALVMASAKHSAVSSNWTRRDARVPAAPVSQRVISEALMPPPSRRAGGALRRRAQPDE